MNAYKPSLKYERARALVRLTDAFLPDVRSETVYAALERRGYTWNGERWVSPAQQQAPPQTAVSVSGEG